MRSHGNSSYTYSIFNSRASLNVRDQTHCCWCQTLNARLTLEKWWWGRRFQEMDGGGGGLDVN